MSPKSSIADEMISEEKETEEKAVMPYMWSYVLYFVTFHVAAFYGVYLAFTSAKWQTNLFALLIYQISFLGITAGAHRLWSHRSYKAKLPLRIFLAFLNSVSNHTSIYFWVRKHRCHHKYSETDADPHNSTRGFFFSHVGWLMRRCHPEYARKIETIDFSDLMDDPVVRYQDKYYFPLADLSCFVLPTVTAMYFWGESFSNAYFVAAILRSLFSLHQVFLINSAAHMWGYRPYDATIRPTENILLSIGSVGEGFHNYHHSFPYDYAASEFGMKYNLSTAFIDLMAFIGQAYDRKTVPRRLIEDRKRRTGERYAETTEKKEI